jgi:aminoglycoside phosphotransferase (APT) family kinase protein
MPRPVHPVHPGASDAWPLADVPVGGTVASFLAHEWCSGDVLAGGPAGSAVSDWVGATLAALHRLPVALGVADAAPSPTHPVDEWQGWLDTARADVAADFVRAVRVFLPEVAAANQVVDRALRPGHGLSPVLTHRDVKPDNVLLTPATPILLDWDGAGPDFAEWEATRAALAFSRSPTGWDARCFTQLISAYEAAGGRRIRRAEASFAGVLHSQLGAAAWMLWRALGHRPVTPAERAADHHHALEILTDLRASLTHLDRWPDWLDDSPA